MNAAPGEPNPLIATKFHLPSRRSTTVPRPRLLERLDRPVKLILVAAPAGFGKTSILGDWLAAQGGDERVAWVSLDERDNDTLQFWTYVVTAVNRGEDGVGAAALALLTSGRAPVEAALATLVNDLDASPRRFVIALDDFHVIDNPVIRSGVEFLLDNLPGNVRLVIASRADPALPLARLRTRGELVEIRAADLRFTPAEASAYLNEVMGLDVTEGDVAALGERTEGWIAALQLAALSMQGRDDLPSFIAEFSGDDRFIVDYLVEEVLQRQPEAMRTFLLKTSILSRLTGDLCDAVTGTTGGAAILETLDRTNLFVVPLDDHREWYRYHHLFAEMLRARLLDERPEQVDDLHRRASAWFRSHEQPAEAIPHAIEGSAFDTAAEMILAATPSMQQNRQELTLVRWFESMPRDIIRSHPGLSLGFAGALLSAGRIDGVESLLADAEAATGDASEGIPAIRRGVALYRAAQALTRGDLQTATEQGRLAAELADPGSDIDRGSAAGLLGLVLWARGDLAEAQASWTLSLDNLLRAGHRSDALGGSIAMADIQLARGALGGAQETYRRALDLAGGTVPPLRGTADMHVGMCELLRERDDLEGARRHLAAAEALGEFAGLPQNRHRRRIAEARLLLVDGDPAAAIALLDEAERLYTPDFFPEVRPIPAVRARALLVAGRVAAARDWARGRDLGVDDELSYLREFEHITLVRILLAEPTDPTRVADATRLLERLLTAAEQGGRGGSILELLVLRTRARHLAGRTEEALDSLSRAVGLAEPEGYVRMFADEGEHMGRLLSALAKRDGASPYLTRLQAAAAGSRQPPVAGAGPIDPLSERELDVLRLLGSDLAGPQIARELVVSLNTLRTHTKNIYAKLGVTSRREAVRRAAELGLLRRS
jgi:LuxR family maltose regulon positive regulatory protein